MRHPSRLLRGLLALAAVPASTALANGSGAPAGIPGYLVDSNGVVVRSSAGDCWHTSDWTPALATVVGCDGVLAKAVPVPAPATSRTTPPARTEPETARAAPQAETPPAAAAPMPAPESRVAPEAAKPAPSAPPAAAAPVVPVPSTPQAPSAGLAPEAPSAEEQKRVRSEKVTLDTDTYFDFDKATLKPEGRTKLDELANRLSGMRLEVVVATGHADATGPKIYNQKLSVQRAQAVKAFLEEKGLPVDKIFTTGKGETQPLATNKTRDGRAKNRRVEVEVVGIREVR